MNSIATLIVEASGHDNIVDGNFDTILAKIQKLIGVQYGDYAGMFFAGKEVAWTKMSNSEKTELVKEYVKAEIDESVFTD